LPGRRYYRQFDKACSAGSSIDPLSRFDVVPRFGEEGVRNEGLRVAIIERKPARLDLHHDPVPGKEHVIRRRQDELVRQRLVGRNRLWCLEAFSITSAEDIHGDAYLISAHVRLARNVVRVDVNELDYPI